MPSFGGLISGVLGSAAKGVGEVAERQSVKNAQLDLRKQLAEAEDAMTQRVEERRRLAGIAEEDRRTSPEYINKMGAADLARGKLTAQNQAALAPDLAAAEAAKYKALIDSGIPAQKAAVDAADWAAGKQNRLTKAAEGTEAKKTEAESLAGDPGHLKNVSALDVAGKAGEIEVAKNRNIFRNQGGGGDKASVVRRVMTDADGNAVAIMSDGSKQDLGMKSSEYNKKIADIQLKMEREDPKFAKKPAAEKRAIAEQVLTGKAPSSAGSSTTRPPIGSFKQP
jgi:hypothetical protein